MIIKLPYWRLSGFYLFIFAILGSFISYWSLYLTSLGFNKLHIGLLMSIFISAKIFSPLFFGYLADISQKSVQIIKISTVLMLFTFIVLSKVTDFWILAIFMFIFGFLISGIIPQFDSLILDFLNTTSDAKPEQYSLLRLWGSVGFVLIIATSGILLEKFSINILPWFIVLIIMACLLVMFSIPNLSIKHKLHALPFKYILFNKNVLIFFLICVLHQASHGAYYTYFSIFLMEHGFNKITIGALWSTGVFAEVIIFIYSPKLLTRFSEYQLITLTLIFTSLRWITTSIFIDNLIPLLLSQLIHAISFGLFHAVAIKYISKLFPKVMQARGQALYSIAGFGIGALLGSILASLTWEIYGGQIVFLLSAGMSAIASLIWFYHNPARIINHNH